MPLELVPKIWSQSELLIVRYESILVELGPFIESYLSLLRIGKNDQPRTIDHSWTSMFWPAIVFIGSTPHFIDAMKVSSELILWILIYWSIFVSLRCFMDRFKSIHINSHFSITRACEFRLTWNLKCDLMEHSLSLHTDYTLIRYLAIFWALSIRIHSIIVHSL